MNTNLNDFLEKKNNNDFTYTKKEEDKTIIDTQEHIDKVAKYIDVMRDELEERGKIHDKEKFSDEELPYFVEYTPKLAGSEYGSKEYKQFLKDLQPALDHHYKHCPHHPEHYDNGIKGMDLVDLLEMFCDWKAASERHKTGDIKKSIEINAKRFKMSDDLKSIFDNTVKYLNNENGRKKSSDKDE